MSDLQGQPGELHMTVSITRKATGLTETHELVGAATEEQARALGALPPTQQEPQDGNHA